MCLDLSHFFACPFGLVNFVLSYCAAGLCIDGLYYPAELLCRIFHRRNEHCQLSSVENRFLIDCTEFRYSFFEFSEHFTSEILVGDFASLESETHSYLIAVLKEFARAVCFCFKVVCVNSA